MGGRREEHSRAVGFRIGSYSRIGYIWSGYVGALHVGGNKAVLRNENNDEAQNNARQSFTPRR